MVPIRPSPGRVAVPLRRRFSRRTVPWWLATVALAVVTGLCVDALVRRASEAEAQWGTSRTVVVATAAIEPGEPLAGATVLRRLPAVAIPPGATTQVGTAAVAVDAIGAGEVVTVARVGGSRAAGVAGRLPPGTRAVVIPLEVSGLPVQVGDRVDLLASGATDAGIEAPPAGPVASRALVVEAHRDELVVAVAPVTAVAVAAALGRGPLVPALVSATG